MRIVEITALSNGAHRNQTVSGRVTTPDGWAVIPDSMTTENFPFGTLEAEPIDGVMTVTAWTPGTIPEPEITDEELAAQAREKRDKLLADTDWTQVLDAPIDEDTKAAYRTYRQALRDVPEQDGFPRDIIWPELPSKTKADPEPVDEAVELLLSGATGEEASA